jgi:hypothetical protein
MYWRDKRGQKDQADKLESVYSNKDGLNRRAFGLFPQPREKKAERIDLSNNVNYQKFLVSLEGQEETTCVRLISPTRKVRAAMLILRGRVLGCVYGRDGEGQILGQDAYTKMTAEMLAGEVIVDAYKIDDKTAIAASAMFHGELFSAPSTMKPVEIFHFSLTHLLDSKMPGTIIINENEATKAVLYTFKGKIHGLFSFAEGWLEPTVEAAEKVLQNSANYSVQASKLLCANIFELKEFTFSMTGLAEKIHDVKQYQSLGLTSELATIHERSKDSLQKALSESREHKDQTKPSQKPWKLGNDL